MRMTLAVHILAGGLAIVAGFVALYAAKGSSIHRKTGMLFVYAMLPLSLTGAVIAVSKGDAGTVISGVLTAYFVITALTAVRPLPGWSRRLDIGLMLMALAMGLTSLMWGFETIASASGRREGLTAFPFFMHGIVGTLAGVGDARMIRAGALRGTRRVARHLWRMCWALWIAAGSFFLGQAKVIPKPIRLPTLLAIPPMVVLVALLYWLWRVRISQTLRAMRFRAHQSIGMTPASTEP